MTHKYTCGPLEAKVLATLRKQGPMMSQDIMRWLTDRGANITVQPSTFSKVCNGMWRKGWIRREHVTDYDIQGHRRGLYRWSLTQIGVRELNKYIIECQAMLRLAK